MVANILTPGYLRWDGSKVVTDPGVEIIGPPGPPGPPGPAGPAGPGATQTLAQTLVLGNTSGTNNIILSSGTEVIFNQNASVPSAPGAGKGALWVKNTSPTTVIFTDSAGVDHTLGSSSQTLAQTLVLGNTTGGHNIIFNSGDKILGTAAAASSNTAGGAVSVVSGNGDGTGAGGAVSLTSGNGGSSGDGGDILLLVGVQGDIGTRNGNISLLEQATTYGGMSEGIFIADAVSVPTTNPVGGGFLYVEAGALKYRGQGGTVTTIAPS